jgi:hypothetical protein
MNKTPLEDLKSKLKTITRVFYIILLIWLVLIVVIIVRFFTDEPYTSLFIGTIPLAALLLILSQLRTKFKKEIEHQQQE